MITGPEGAGKTHLLYKKRLLQGVEHPMTPTVGYNYEEIESNTEESGKRAVAGFWDIGGGEASQ